MVAPDRLIPGSSARISRAAMDRYVADYPNLLAPPGRVLRNYFTQGMASVCRLVVGVPPAVPA